MNKNLLIIGASTYGVVAYEIATDMGCFEKIDFVDDERKTTPNGIDVVGTTQDIDELALQYSNIIVAIGNPEVRLSLLNRIKEETPYRIVSLVSPKAYVSPSAQIMSGCIIEPMAVVHTGCVIAIGCFVSAGAVVNYASMCCDGVHIDCNATVADSTMIPAGMKIRCGEVYDRKNVEINDLFFDAEVWAKSLNEIKHPHTPTPINGKTYNFEDVM
jgi:UDP-N-acetylbacillosamine N-acetyltransferase